MENYCGRNATAEDARIQNFNLGRVNRGPTGRGSRSEEQSAGVRFLAPPARGCGGAQVAAELPVTSSKSCLIARAGPWPPGGVSSCVPRCLEFQLIGIWMGLAISTLKTTTASLGLACVSWEPATALAADFTSPRLQWRVLLVKDSLHLAVEQLDVAVDWLT